MCVYRYIFLLAYALNSGGAFVFLAESMHCDKNFQRKFAKVQQP